MANMTFDGLYMDVLEVPFGGQDVRIEPTAGSYTTADDVEQRALEAFGFEGTLTGGAETAKRSSTGRSK